MQSIIVILVVAITTASSVRAQDSSSPILSCLDLKCPNPTGPGACTVGNQSFNTVGNTPILSTSSALSGLSWTEGASILDSTAGRTFEKSFYLGTPPSLNLTNTGGCAIFFTEVSKAVVFNSNAISRTVSQGTCKDAISKECILALTKSAQEVDYEGLGSADVCQSIRKSLTDKVDPACVKYTTDGTWTGLSAKGKSPSIRHDEQLESD